MTTKVLVKQLAGEEDLLLGSGTVTQNRNGTDLPITKIGLFKIVDSEAELLALDTEKFKYAKRIEDGKEYTYAFNGSSWEPVAIAQAVFESFGVLRAYADNLTYAYVLGREYVFDGLHGIFVVDQADSTSSDNDLTIIVDSVGRRWKRQSKNSRAMPYSLASMPRVMRAMDSYNEATGQPFKIVGMGSSVGNGASLPIPATQSPVAKFAEYFSTYFDKIGILNTTFVNRSVDGSTLNGGVSIIDLVLAEESPNIVVLCYGMNDGATAQFNGNQTYPFVYANLKIIAEKCRAAGCDIVIMTTPHPHPDRLGWSMPASVPMVYPTSVPAPVADEDLIPPVSESIKQIKHSSGANIRASHRHYRVNQAMRRAAIDLGVALIDVEQYWFDAVVAEGYDNLYAPSEFVHPNLLGHQLSYWAAIFEFISALGESYGSGVQQNSYFVGKVGINSQSPSAELEVSGVSPLTDVFIAKTASGAVGAHIDGSGNMMCSNATTQTFGHKILQVDPTPSASKLTSEKVFFGNVGAAQTYATPADSAGTVTVFGIQNGIGRQCSVYNFLNSAGTVSVANSGSINDGAVFSISGSGANIVITPVAPNTNLNAAFQYVHV